MEEMERLVAVVLFFRYLLLVGEVVWPANNCNEEVYDVMIKCDQKRLYLC